MSRLRACLLAAALAAASPCLAASWEYSLALPDGLPATFAVSFPVTFAGTVTVEAEWSGGRLLFFGVDGPGDEAIAHRSGPSPQRLDIPAAGEAIGSGVAWTLTIKALPARGGGAGRVRVTVPDAPAIVAAREAAAHPPPPPPPPPPAWTLPQAAPAGAPAPVVSVFEAVEAFRALVTAKDAPPDTVGWQRDFLEYAAAARDRLGSIGAPPDTPTLRYFERLADAARTVEGLRTSKDPILAGPVPDDREEKRGWLIARSEMVRPIERKLDRLTELLRGGHAPALEEERFVPRFTACLTACERYFDERVRLGDADGAPSGDLARAQWDRIVAAGRVFDAFAGFLPAQEREPPLP